VLATRFPKLVGRSLLGEPMHLPADLPAERTLVLCAFRQQQQGVVDRWISRSVRELGVAGSPHGRTDLARAVIEVPCLGRQWRIARRFIDGGMASSIRDPLVLARTVTVYDDVTATLRALGSSSPHAVQARVVLRSGEILAAAEGEPEGAGWEVISAALISP